MVVNKVVTFFDRPLLLMSSLYSMCAAWSYARSDGAHSQRTPFSSILEYVDTKFQLLSLASPGYWPSRKLID